MLNFRIPGEGRVGRLIRAYHNRKVFDYEPIFICGVGGSGNTLVASLLNERFEVCGFADESALFASSNSVLKVKHSGNFNSLSSYVESLRFRDDLSGKNILCDSIKIYRGYQETSLLSNKIIDKAPNSHMLRSASLSKVFPESYFLVVFRNPISHIEGMVRKWRLYRNSSMEEVCSYWNTMHSFVIDNSSEFKDRLIWIEFESFLKDTDNILSDIASKVGLKKRTAIKKSCNRSNVQGFALRNVMNGEIQVDKSSLGRAIDRLPKKQKDKIENACGVVYSKLKDLST